VRPSAESPSGSTSCGAPDKGAPQEQDPGLFLYQILTAPAFSGVSSRAEVESVVDRVNEFDAGEDHRFQVEVSPGRLRVGQRREPPAVRVRDVDDTVRSERGPIVRFSPSSRRRLLATMGTLDLAEITGRGVFITLTYPGNWRPFCADGRRAKEHLLFFRRHWVKRWGPFRGVWKLEFQPRRTRPHHERRAPHFHLLVVVPAFDPCAATPTPVAINDLRDWVANIWARIVNSDDDRHRRAGTQVVEADPDSATNLIAYFAGYAYGKSKADQHEPPEGWGAVGRFWGVVGIERIAIGAGISDSDFFVLRRILLTLIAKRSRRQRRSVGHETFGAWVSIPGAPQLLARILDWMDGKYPDRTLP
jgi:hypothetical protein